MSIDSERDLAGMKRAGATVAEALKILKEAVAPGVSTHDLDALCGEVFARHGAVSAPRLVYGAPVNAFFSINADVVHGLPERRKLRAGDLVKIDVTPFVEGYIADAAVTVAVPPAPKVALKLIACAEAAFWAAMRVARAGKPLYVIGQAVEREVKRRGLTVIGDLAGHGVGRAIHEAPEVLNFYYPQHREPLTEGLVLAVEPIIAKGRGEVETRADGWTIGTRDGSLTAHYEHTVVVTKGQPLILTA